MGNVCYNILEEVWRCGVDGYLEQSVAGRQGPGRAALYGLCWALIVLLGLAAVVFAASVLGGAQDRVEVDWRSLLGFLLCAALAIALFLRKDALRMEYDYILRDGALEICGIFNRRRRKRLACIPLEQIGRMGRAGGAGYEAALRQPGLKRHDWNGRGDALYYLCYMEENARHMAVLELNGEMIGQIRGSARLPRGAWRDAEGKDSNASLS